MKKLVLISLLMFSCNQKEASSETLSKTDSATVNAEVPADHLAEEIIDSAKDNRTDSTAARNGMIRQADGDKIIRIADASQLPFSIDEEFTEENQQFILKIKNFDRQNISGKITPENSKMNIRFNQIKLPDGSFDGPFGREMIYKTRENGEIWFIIAKSNMASGPATGKFSVKIN